MKISLASKGGDALIDTIIRGQRARIFELKRFLISERSFSLFKSKFV